MKQSYIKMRQTGKYDVKWFYKYFIEKGGNRLDAHAFAHLFNFVNLQEVLNFLDGEFELTKLEDKEGRLIKIID